MDKNKRNEKPEVYALRQENGSWQISRRDFLKAAGLGMAVMGVGMQTRFVKPVHAADDLDTLCKSSPAHQAEITHLLTSPDGKYLISRDSGGTMKCWDFQNHALLGATKNAFAKNEPKQTAMIDGKPCVISENTDYYELPNNASSTKHTLVSSTANFSSFTLDSSGNLYAIQNQNKIVSYSSKDRYQKAEELTTLSRNGGSIRFLEGSRRLLIELSQGFAVYDLTEEKLQTFEENIPLAAVLSGEARALVCGSRDFSLISLLNGNVIWRQSLSDFGSLVKISGLTVTPDGSMGILASSDHQLYLISLERGTILKQKKCGTVSSVPAQLAVARDGSRFAFAVGSSILFFSLPDLEIIGCPVDLSEMIDSAKGIEVTATDPLTGKMVTYTLPCGAPIPEGAVCVCNCVAGDVCSCVGHTVCTCDTVCSCVGNTYTYCSCDTVCTCEGDGHYWYPN